MVSLRPFLFGLTLSISLHSFAFSHKDMEGKQVLVAAANTFALVGRSPLSLSKEIFETRGDAKIDGRKMMKKDIFKAQEKNIVDGKPNSSKILGASATSDNRKMKRSKSQNKDFNMSDESEIFNVGQRRRLKVRMDDSVSLDADYKAPKSHPPKNN